MMEIVEDKAPPLEQVLVPMTQASQLGESIPGKINIFTVHDGTIVPPRFVVDKKGQDRLDRAQLLRQFCSNRDWGADRVAGYLARDLATGSYLRCRIARVLLDFNRFPGTTLEDAKNPLDHFAISDPFGALLSHAEKMDLLTLYDEMSDLIERSVEASFLNLAIHTYDAHNKSATERPDVSIVSTPHTYFHESRMPVGVFDKIFPNVLAESTCSRILRDRISLNFERNGFRVSHNQPYALPEGSVEVRSQVWFFFRFLKRRFEETFPASADQASFALVWKMLLNTNLRSQDGATLSGYLHRYRRPNADEEQAFMGARDAYHEVMAFTAASGVVSEYRSSPSRPSSLAIEVRKDLLCSFDAQGLPMPVTAEQDAKAAEVARIMAEAIEIFVDTDRRVAVS